MKKAALYFLLAVLPALTQLDKPPETGWEWFRWVAIGLYQGLLALRALDSSPSGDPIEVKAPPGKPLAVQETEPKKKAKP